MRPYRHGWGTTRNPTLGLTYLSQAASNSAAIESQALHSGMKKGGAAKGELVLAMYELANSFRHGWGVEKDPVAARSYYETAANLGDTDAMNEVARCYEEGFGGRKDKVCSPLIQSLMKEGSSCLVANTVGQKPSVQCSFGSSGVFGTCFNHKKSSFLSLHISLSPQIEIHSPQIDGIGVTLGSNTVLPRPSETRLTLASYQ